MVYEDNPFAQGNKVDEELANKEREAAEESIHALEKHKRQMEQAQAQMANELKRLKNDQALDQHQQQQSSTPRKKRKKKKGEGNFQRAIAGTDDDDVSEIINV